MNIDVYEAAVLSLTLRADYAAQVFDKIQPSDFSGELHQYAQTAYDLLQENKAVDLLTVAERMELEGITNAGEMLAQIVEQSNKPSIENLPAYCDILSNRGLRQNLYSAALISRQILDEEPDPQIAHEKILAEFEGVQTSKEDDSLWDMARASREFLLEMERRHEAKGELIGLSTGYQHLDDRINGLRGGDLVVVAGRPSMGKSTFAMNVVEQNAVRDGIQTLVFSMEMSAPQILEKMTASLGKINLNSLRRGTLSDDDGEWARFSSANKLIQSASLHIDDRGGLSVAQMRARAHAVRRKTGSLGLIMVDYLQLMQGKAENRTQEITKISGGLKSLAKEFKCPVIALSQLSRAVELRQDKRPMMSDLRESGAIEQDADIIIFPFRQGYYDNPDDPDSLTEIIFGKIRMGERGSEALHFEGQFSRFVPVDHKIDFSAKRAADAAAWAETQQGYSKKKRGMSL